MKEPRPALPRKLIEDIEFVHAHSQGARRDTQIADAVSPLRQGRVSEALSRASILQAVTRARLNRLDADGALIMDWMFQLDRRVKNLERVLRWSMILLLVASGVVLGVFLVF